MRGADGSTVGGGHSGGGQSGGGQSGGGDGHNGIPSDEKEGVGSAGSSGGFVPDGGTDRTTLNERMVRMSQIGNRTNLMAIDAVLRAVPRNARGYSDAALETAVISRRVARATGDLAAFLREAAAEGVQH